MMPEMSPVERHVLEQAKALNMALRSEWEAEGPLRSFHTRYLRNGMLHDAVVLQQRGSYAFKAGMVTYGASDQIDSIGLSLRALIVWFGLDTVEEIAAWRIEL